MLQLTQKKRGEIQKMTLKNSFLLKYPELKEQWCFDKNQDVNPYEIPSSSDKRAYLVCEKGHVWDATIGNRAIRGQGCPYCAGRRVSKDNCLATMNPELAKEWNYEKNKELTPELVTAVTGKKVWWKCSYNHEWEASIRNRNKGAGCHYCTKQKTLKKDSIAFLLPELMKEWNYEKNIGINPEGIPLKSTKVVWWKCDNHHEWEDKILNRTTYESNACPVCQSLAFLRPDIALEWDYGKNSLSPSNIAVGSHMKAWWKCSEGHEWEERIRNRTKKQIASCPTCESLVVKHPELLEEWDFDKNKFNPIEIKPGSGKKVWWKCIYNHEWESTVAHRALRGQGCPKCNSQTSFPEQYIAYVMAKHFSDVESRKKIDGVEIDVFIPSLSLGIEYDGVRWHKGRLEKDKQKDHVFSSKGIQLIRIREDGLEELDTSIIFKIAKSPKPEDLQGVYVELIHYINERFFENNRIIPEENIPYHEVLEYITYKQKEKNLAFTHIHLVEEWDYEKNGNLKPTHFTHGSTVEVWWKCERGHSWKKVINKRSQGESCPYCSGRRADEINNLSEQFPHIAKEWNVEKNGPLKPQHITPKSGKRVWWKCGKNHEWEAVVSSRTKANCGCPYCSGRKSSEEYNLVKTHFELSEQWHPTKNNGLLPEDVTPGSIKKVWWKCEKNHEWEAAVAQRAGSNTNCPYCSGRRVTKERSLSVHKPHLVKEWHTGKNKNLTPNDVTVYSGKKVWWICSNNHEWEAKVSNRSYGKGCPECYKENRKSIHN
ncbi:hypothetical protein CON36_31100 [Bacillus cereus]|uniref:Treble clef zinc finger domain-containing protein n=2 Tax=Bacillus cereus TaxID=1396 RepID=A0A9X6STN2_BACCE|nr:hypothetical protein CON36_31100 [Bacillus cereus]